ncbi:MAG: hypothetical protein CME13_08530 [Gemmatimonadetes bacterium]|nr:hypothetical protein [Gemmatimonadota bacterium]
MRRGYRVRGAIDGVEGLAAVREQAPSLIISDVDIPNMDGYALCEAIKDDPQLRSIPVILLTSLRHGSRAGHFPSVVTDDGWTNVAGE